jgi:PAS domain S-box-containing protein
LLASYHAQIAELESMATGFRQNIQHLTARLTEANNARSHYTELFEKVPAAYLIHDSVGYIYESNRGLEDLLAITSRIGPKQSLVKFIAEADLAVWLDHIRRCNVTRQQTVSELNLRRGNGSTIAAQMVTIPEPRRFPRKPERYHTLIADIQRQQEAQKALVESQRNYQRLIDTIEGIVWEAETRPLAFTFVSRYGERLLGYPVQEWMRPSFFEEHIHVLDRDRVLMQLNRAAAQHMNLQLDYRVLAADRRVVWLHNSVAAIEHYGQAKFLGVAVDVTERRAAEERLRQAHNTLERRVAERTAELRQTIGDLEAFSYSLSHDMRAPIRAMRGYAELLQGMLGDKLGPQAVEFLHRIMEGSERLDLLVQDVLKYSRLARAPIELQPISLDRVVDNVLHDYPTLSPEKAEIEVERPLLPVHGHEAFLSQAVSNLLTNAVKFMPQGRTPRVRLWTEMTRRTSAEKNEQERNGWVRMWVEDNGVGVAAEDQKRIFRIFERVYSQEQYEGTGMGLAIAQKAAERLGGRVGVQSELGKGSRFWLELRAANPGGVPLEDKGKRARHEWL